MSDEKKPFSDPRWTQDIATKVIGHRELTEEEKEAVKRHREIEKRKKNGK